MLPSKGIATARMRPSMRIGGRRIALSPNAQPNQSVWMSDEQQRPAYNQCTDQSLRGRTGVVHQYGMEPLIVLLFLVGGKPPCRMSAINGMVQMRNIFHAPRLEAKQSAEGCVDE